MRFRNRFTEEFFGVDGSTLSPTRETEMTSAPAPTSTTRPPVSLVPSPYPTAPAQLEQFSGSPSTQEPTEALPPVTTLIQGIRPPEGTIILVEEAGNGELMDAGSNMIPGGVPGSQPYTGGGGYGGGGGGAMTEEEMIMEASEAETAGSKEMEPKSNKARNIIIFVLIAIAVYVLWKRYGKQK